MMAVGLIGVVLLCSCGSGGKTVTPISGPPQAGATYSLDDGEGGFRVGKVLGVEEEIVFLSLYDNRWTARPSLVEARQARTPAGLAYRLPSFAGLQPVHLENAQVSADELESFEEWQRSKRDLF